MIFQLLIAPKSSFTKLPYDFMITYFQPISQAYAENKLARIPQILLFLVTSGRHAVLLSLYKNDLLGQFRPVNTVTVHSKGKMKRRRLWHQSEEEKSLWQHWWAYIPTWKLEHLTFPLPVSLVSKQISITSQVADIIELRKTKVLGNKWQHSTSNLDDRRSYQ